MIKARVLLAAITFLSITSCRTGDNGNAETNASDESCNNTSNTDTIVEKIPSGRIDGGKYALQQAYPDFIKSIDGNTVRFKDGDTMPYDDGKEKDFDTMLDNSDIDDMFFCKYDSNNTPPEYLADAGRSRCEALFKKMYGSSPEQATKNLVNVSWMGKNVKFTRVNGAADSLAKVADELSRHPELKKYTACSGTYYWRKVRGAERQSAHSYGIAIDIAVPYSDYWLWKNPKAKETDHITYANRFPHELVEIFEHHGFIWGGAWYHFDTMHFEFRPEILLYSRLPE